MSTINNNTTIIPLRLLIRYAQILFNRTLQRDCQRLGRVPSQ